MNRSAVRILLGALLALAPAVAVAADLEVKVVVADGKPIKSGRLFVFDQTVELNDAGTFPFRNLPDKRVVAGVEAQVGQGLFRGSRRYVGVQSATLLPNKPVSVTITIQPEPDMNAFCSGCHPSRGQEIKPGQVMRDLHPSGKELSDKHLAQVKKYNEKAELQRKQNLPNPVDPILLEERVVVVNGKELKKQFFTCESCHTVHLKTIWTKLARAGFVESSDLCLGCHY